MSEPVDQHFVDTVKELAPARERRNLHAPVRDGTTLTGEHLCALFDAQAGSRHLDFAARWLRGQGEGFYTIGSAGHEANAAVADAVRPTDPALLHYRSGAFYLARALQVPRSEPLRDVLLGLVAAAEEPISGGRHKVFGNADLAIIPQTSTIASHLPRVVGVAFAISRAAKLAVPSAWPSDAIAVGSFGDASANHSTATGAINTACQVAHSGLPMPVLFVCEDNGIGISVRTPKGWVENAYGHRPGLAYFAADGADTLEAYEVARAAAEHVRTTRSPAFLHLSVVRYMAHAGTDAEIGYRTRTEIEADYEHDPLIGTARLLVSSGVATRDEVLQRYERIRSEVMGLAEKVCGSQRLSNATEVMAPLAPRRPETVASIAGIAADEEARRSAFEGKLPEEEGPLTLANAINRALTDALAVHREMLVYGEDVGRKGGVYGVTQRLTKRFGAARVFDSLLDEQSILGIALGAGVTGMLPVPEIQYLAYLHNAEDQLRGEAATQQFFSNGQYRNGMVLRLPGYAYQKGFGGHFHNDDAIGALRDIPGLVIASPSRPDDAAAMLRTCLAAAKADGSVCVYLEPIALYHTRDLHADGDSGWLAPYAPPEEWANAHVPLGRARTYGDGGDLTMVTFGNGLAMSLRVAAHLASSGINARVVDLRWLAPLPTEDLLREARATGRVLVVDETRRTGGASEGILTALIDAGYDGDLARVASEDSFIPLGDAAYHVLLDEPTIEHAARDLVG
ncbi:MAG: thiamine pyrophosphate-dependent enzyme [Streptosporangiales bacterium]